MNFHFPLMPRLFMALRMEDTFPIVDILQQTPEIPENCQWGLFLRNHDELTLEMVTDEDRDYMYRVYAQDPEMRVNLGIRRRLAPLLGNDRRQIEMLTSLLLSLPGTPVLYYGDEIGMGDNVYVGDRNGVRTPMQWSPDRNAGFSRANPHRLYLPLIVDSEYHYNTVNVEAQRANPNSLLNAMKRLIATRKRFQALGRGDFQLLHPDNRKVLAFTRSYEDEQILVVVNLSRFVQTVELDLSLFKGRIPIEIFGRTEFPPVSDSPYFLSLGPYAIYWFMLKLQPALLQAKPTTEMSTLVVGDRWQAVFWHAELKSRLETLLPDFLMQYSWFSGRTRPIQMAQIVEAISLPYQEREAYLICLRVDYMQGVPQNYWMFLSQAEGERAIHLLADAPQSVVARLRSQGVNEVAVLFDAIADKGFLTSLLTSTLNHKTFRGVSGELTATATELFALFSKGHETVDPIPLKGEHSNTSIIYSDATRVETSPQLILKLFRKAEEGINPDLEVRRFLDQQGTFANFPSIAGYWEYHQAQTKPTTVGILQQYIPDARNTWDYTLDSLRDYFEYVAVQLVEMTVPLPAGTPLELQTAFEPEIGRDDLLTRGQEDAGFTAPQSMPGSIAPELGTTRLFAAQTIGAYLANVQLLGQRTAELHIALASNTEDPNFAPEPFTSFYQRSIYQYSRNLAGQVFLLLKDRWHTLAEEVKPLAQKALDDHPVYLERFRLILDQKITALRTRYHGHYHLGQVLYTGKDFFIIDFEGDATRTVSERRMKRSPLRDIAGMLQSFHYAVNYALDSEVESGIIHPEQCDRMHEWALFWEDWVSAAFLNAYLATANQDAFLPKTQQELKALLDNYLLERAIHDLGYELNHRPEKVKIPLQRILQFVNQSS